MKEESYTIDQSEKKQGHHELASLSFDDRANAFSIPLALFCALRAHMPSV